MKKRKILILGSGRSSYVLIRYLLDFSVQNNWIVTVGDVSFDLVNKSTNGHKNARPITFDVYNDHQRKAEIVNHDIVVSMLPANLHAMVAYDCVKIRRHLVTASYVSKEISSLHENAKRNNVILLNEIGLDPGLDHMSAMKIIDKIKSKNGYISSFKSYCGGLVHPDSDDNPWNYKFTWNPKNVVLAGQGIAQYMNNGKCKYIPYNKLFKRTEKIKIQKLGEFEGYANRDSLSYRKLYGINDIKTMLRGTLRKVGFCSSWDVFVQLGITDDTYEINNLKNMSYKEFLNLFLPYSKNKSIENKFCDYFSLSQSSEIFEKIDWLGLFSNKKILLEKSSPARVLQSILESNWSLTKQDKDMIVMIHKFIYEINDVSYKIDSSLCVYGDNNLSTAMAKTVGLPVAIATKLILENKINNRGVLIPTSKDIYEPVLLELEKNNIRFIENSY
tara:strand:+ start:3214 stop:4548 length:1335 start_codon:yes stop_codon:yes gene_type:complete